MGERKEISLRVIPRHKRSFPFSLCWATVMEGKKKRRERALWHWAFRPLSLSRRRGLWWVTRAVTTKEAWRTLKHTFEVSGKEQKKQLSLYRHTLEALLFLFRSCVVYCADLIERHFSMPGALWESTGCDSKKLKGSCGSLEKMKQKQSETTFSLC